MRSTTLQREIWTPPRAEVRLHNHFLAELRNAKSGKLVQTAEAENVVTNIGRNHLADQRYLTAGVSYSNRSSDSGFMCRCLLGTGSTAPATTDTKLATKVSLAGQASGAQVGAYTQYMADAASGTWWVRRKFQFSELVANYRLTEIGLGWSGGYRDSGVSINEDNSSSASPYDEINTRALFRDANGAPITITKTSSQILTITATVYLTRGGVDSNMVLTNEFFDEMVRSDTQSQTFWYLGDGGATAPSNADTTLKGTKLATKSDNGITQWMWDDASAAWTSSWQDSNRPAGKQGVSPFSMDWDLSEANVTFGEVVARWYSSAVVYATIVRLVFPCGTVTGASYTKTNQVKLRQYFEIVWG